MSDFDDDLVIKDDDDNNKQSNNKQPKGMERETTIGEPDFEKNIACLLLIGKPKRGKSNAVKYFLMRNLLNGVFKFGLVFTKTKYSGEYKYLPDKYIYSGFDQSVLEDYLNGMEALLEKGKKVPINFVVFDDLLGLLSKTNPTLLNFFACHRHTNTVIFLCAQHLKTAASTTLRKICTDAIMFNSKNKNTLEALFECFGQLFENFDEFKNYFFKLTSEPYTACYYKQDIDDINENYVKFQAPNLDGYEDQVNIEY